MIPQEQQPITVDAANHGMGYYRSISNAQDFSTGIIVIPLLFGIIAILIAGFIKFKK